MSLHTAGWRAQVYFVPHKFARISCLSIFSFSHDRPCRSPDVRPSSFAPLPLPFFPLFFVLLLQHKTTYCDGPLKNSTTSSFFGGKPGPGKQNKHKGTFFMDWTRQKSASLTCFIFLTQPRQLRKPCEWRSSQEPGRTAGPGTQSQETFLTFVKY